MMMKQFLLSKRNISEKLKKGTQINQQPEIFLPDTFGSEENINKHETNDMKIHEFRDELSNQTSTNQSLLKGKIDGKLDETIMLFKDSEAFEKCLESTDENYDEGSIFVQQADILRETNNKIVKSQTK